jgi:glutamate-1-semialdehyde 2,1-aminomutase
MLWSGNANSQKDIMARTIPEASITAMLASAKKPSSPAQPEVEKALAEDAAKNWLRGVPMHWMVDWGTPFPLFVSKGQRRRRHRC